MEQVANRTMARYPQNVANLNIPRPFHPTRKARRHARGTRGIWEYGKVPIA